LCSCTLSSRLSYVYYRAIVAPVRRAYHVKPSQNPRQACVWSASGQFPWYDFTIRRKPNLVEQVAPTSPRRDPLNMKEGSYLQLERLRFFVAPANFHRHRIRGSVLHITARSKISQAGMARSVGKNTPRGLMLYVFCPPMTACTFMIVSSANGSGTRHWRSITKGFLTIF